MPDELGTRPRWLRLIAGASLVVVPAVVAVPRWDTLLANQPIYPVILAVSLLLGLALIASGLATRRPPKPGRPRLAARIAASVGALGIAAALLWLAPLSATPVALAALESDESVTVTDTRDATSYEPSDATNPTFVLYPGARVDPRAYAVLARGIAESGSPVVVPKCPMDLSLLCGGPGDYLPTAGPWAVGGHSLGGVSASSLVADDVPAGTGLILWASYPLDDLSARSDLPVASVYGTQDRLTTLSDISANRPKLPADTVYTPIEGAIHAYFGDYGSQPGDGDPEISRDEAQDAIVQATVDALARVAETASPSS